jgi:hypothetical protein
MLELSRVILSLLEQSRANFGNCVHAALASLYRVALLVDAL